MTQEKQILDINIKFFTIIIIPSFLSFLILYLNYDHIFTGIRFRFEGDEVGGFCKSYLGFSDYSIYFKAIFIISNLFLILFNVLYLLKKYIYSIIFLILSFSWIYSYLNLCPITP